MKFPGRRQLDSTLQALIEVLFSAKRSSSARPTTDREDRRESRKFRQLVSATELGRSSWLGLAYDSDEARWRAITR